MAALFANISTGLSAQFGGPYAPGQIITQIAPIYDDGGSIVTPGGVEARDCQVQVDNATEAMRQAEGFADTDRRMLVLAASFAGDISTDDKVRVLEGPFAGDWMIASVTRDPFASYWEIRGRKA